MVSGVLLGAGGGAIERIRLHGAAAPAGLPLLDIDEPELVDPHWVALHRDRQHPAPFDLCALRLRDVTLGGNGWIWQGGAPLTLPELTPGYALDAAAAAPHPVRERFLDLPVRRERRRGLIFQSWGIGVYGHFLIETLPRLLLAGALAALAADYRPVLDRNAPDWLVEILARYLGIAMEQAIWFDSERERLALDDALTLPLVGRDGFHPALGPAIDRLTATALRVTDGPAALALNAPSERLFIRRAGFTNPHSNLRVIDNEDALTAIAAEAGLTPIRPETLPWIEQVSLFARASVVVGAFGSGMHNALFVPAGGTVGTIRFDNPVQAEIAALRGQRIAYLTAGISEVAPGHFVCAPERFRRFLDRLLGERTPEPSAMTAMPTIVF